MGLHRNPVATVPVGITYTFNALARCTCATKLNKIKLAKQL